MRLGLLICDESKSTIDHPCGSYLNMFQKLFEDYEEVELIAYDIRQGQYPEDFTALDGFVSTGSTNSVYDDIEWIKEFEKFIQRIHRLKIKYFGVCFGHQMLAKALGGEVAPADQGWMVGVKSVEVHSPQEWMNIGMQLNTKLQSSNQINTQLHPQKHPKFSPENQPKLNVISSHKDQVLRLPANGVSIASSPGCPHAMIVVGQYLAGIQGHPEFHRDYAEPLLESRRSLIGDDIVDTAKPTFESILNSQEVARWIVDFMKRAYA